MDLTDPTDLTALTKTIILPRRYLVSAKIPDKKLYAVRLAKIVALVACSPLLAGLIGLFAGNTVAVTIFGVTLVVAICVGTRTIK